MPGLFFLRVILRAFLYPSPKNRKKMEPLLMEGCRSSTTGEGMVKSPVEPEAEVEPEPEPWRARAILELIFNCCMKTAMALAGVYFVFLSYVALTYAPTLAEKLRLSPLFLLAIIVPLLGVVMIREK